ncbi:MAG: alpha/beta hydrolase [Dehalococcoidia bacterium]
MTDTRHRTIQTNGISMHIAEAGTGPAVVLCHGWPELWYSWRHQIPALAEAGYHVIAPDMRGYGGTDAPADPKAYRASMQCADMAGLLDALGLEKAVFVGHDWGGSVIWNMGVLRADRVRALVGLNTPHFGGPASPVPTTQIIAQTLGGGAEHWYMLYFQEPGIAEAELEADIPRSFRRIMKGYRNADEFWTFATVGGDGSGVIEKLSDEGCILTESELKVFVDEFTRTGFRGGLNWYRAMDHSWEESRQLPPEQSILHLPAMMVTAADDAILKPAFAAGMPALIPGIRMEQIENCAHWTQQERPEEVNRLLLDFLGKLPA